MYGRFSAVTLRKSDRIASTFAAAASGRSPTLKVSVGYLAGYVGEGEISYAGVNALARARLAGEIVRQRLRCISGYAYRPDRQHVVARQIVRSQERPYEIRLRVAARAATAERRDRRRRRRSAIPNGPAGGGGARESVQEQIGIVSTLIERERVTARSR